MPKANNNFNIKRRHTNMNRNPCKGREINKLPDSEGKQSLYKVGRG